MLRRYLARAGWWILLITAGFATAGFIVTATITGVWSTLVVAVVPPAVGALGLWLLLDGRRDEANAMSHVAQRA